MQKGVFMTNHKKKGRKKKKKDVHETPKRKGERIRFLARLSRKKKEQSRRRSIRQKGGKKSIFYADGRGFRERKTDSHRLGRRESARTTPARGEKRKRWF